MWWKLARYLRAQLPRFAAATVVSAGEQALLRQVAPTYRPIYVLENGVEFGPAPVVVPQVDTMIYSGAVTYRANYDAVHYFVDQILPRIRARRPAATLTVTGGTGAIDLTPLLRPGVTFSGYLANVAPAIAGSWVAVVPLRLGSGTRLKVLEALSLGTPVVSTAKGVEGLQLVAEHDLLVADGPEAFADAVCRVLEDRALRQRLAAQGGATIAARYDWRRIGEQLHALVDDALEEAV
jgi:glycosyltransferase involved in cell wall biosynthesis